MGSKNETKTPQTPIILPFPTENQTPQLSIKIDDAETRFLYREYYPLVFSRCLAILGNREDAQDTAQDVFEKILELKSKDILHVQYPKTYLSTAAKNMVINKKRRARKELNKIYEIATDESLSRFKDKWEQGQEAWELGVKENDYDQAEAEIIVKAILDEQDKTTRKIYFCKYHDGMTLEQIGEVVGLGKSAVQKRIKNLEEQVKVEMGMVSK